MLAAAQQGKHGEAAGGIRTEQLSLFCSHAQYNTMTPVGPERVG